jgi:hypothetical protein
MDALKISVLLAFVILLYSFQKTDHESTANRKNYLEDFSEV